MNKKQILVIGTEPPCPRCDLLYRMVDKITKNQTDVHLNHCSFDSQEAIKLGQKLDLKIGTAKQVSKEAGIIVDWDEVYNIIDKNKVLIGNNGIPADFWSQELDDILEPCEKAASAVGYLMTPVLIVNGKVEFFGSSKSRKTIRNTLHISLKIY